MSATIKKLYQVEQEIKDYLIMNKGYLSTNEEFYEINSRKSEIIGQLYRENNITDETRIDYGFELFKDIKIPVNILQQASFKGMSGKIENYNRANIDSFFLEKFNIDVSNVDVIETLSIPENAEAFASECGENNHYIAINPNNGFLSYDLLVHEFGHTVEFTERRKKDSPADILTFPVLSEAIAHYYQMAYMLEHSTKDERLGMLASVTESYLFHNCMKIMTRNSPEAIQFDRELIKRDPEFAPFLQAYNGTGVLENFFKRYENENFHLYYIHLHSQRAGVYLSLNFIKNKLDITELLSIKFGQGDVISLEGQISKTNINPEVLFDFSDMEETISKFVEGTLIV